MWSRRFSAARRRLLQPIRHRVDRHQLLRGLRLRHRRRRSPYPAGDPGATPQSAADAQAVLLGPADHSDYTNQTWHAAFRHRSALASGAWCRNGYQADAWDRGLPLRSAVKRACIGCCEEAVATTGIAVTCAPEGGTRSRNRRCSHRCGSDGSGDWWNLPRTHPFAMVTVSVDTRTRMSAVSRGCTSTGGVDLGLGRRGRHRGHSRCGGSGRNYAGDDLLDVLHPDPPSLETVRPHYATTITRRHMPIRMWSNRADENPPQSRVTRSEVNRTPAAAPDGRAQSRRAVRARPGRWPLTPSSAPATCATWSRVEVLVRTVTATRNTSRSSSTTWASTCSSTLVDRNVITSLRANQGRGKSARMRDATSPPTAPA